jgi:hypothetical protein
MDSISCPTYHNRCSFFGPLKQESTEPDEALKAEQESTEPDEPFTSKAPTTFLRITARAIIYVFFIAPAVMLGFVVTKGLPWL